MKIKYGYVRYAPKELPCRQAYVRVGQRWAGTWLPTRGMVCNGLLTGKLFLYSKILCCILTFISSESYFKP